VPVTLARPVELAQLLNIRVDQLPWTVALKAARQLLPIKMRKRPEPLLLEPARYRGLGQTELRSNRSSDIRGRRRTCRMNATVEVARRRATRAGALTWYESGTPPPARNSPSHLLTVHTDTAKAATIWPVTKRAKICFRLLTVRLAF
jgi:hypothetical protein